MRIQRNLFLAISLIFILTAGYGLSDVKNTTGDQQYKSVRAMGMGNAFSAVADDGDALYYNPAGIAIIGNLQVEIQPVRLILTRDLYGEIRQVERLIDDIREIEKSAEPLEDPTLKDERLRLTSRIKRLTHENLGFDIAVPARIIVPFNVGSYSVAVGGMMYGWTESQIQMLRRGLRWSDFAKDVLDNEVLYRIMAEVSYSGSAAISAPVPPLPLELSLGITARKIHQRLMTDEDDPMTAMDLLNPKGDDGIEGTADDLKNRYFDPENPLESIHKGRGFASDIGAMASLYDSVKIAVVFQNLVGKINYETIKDRKLSRHIGISSAVNLAKVPDPDVPMLDIILSAGLDDLNKDVKARLGLEVVWKPLSLLSLSVRMGTNQGFLTLGAGMKLMFLDIDYAFYGDEVTDWHAFSLNMAF